MSRSHNSFSYRRGASLNELRAVSLSFEKDTLVPYSKILVIVQRFSIENCQFLMSQLFKTAAIRTKFRSFQLTTSNNLTTLWGYI